MEGKVKSCWIIDDDPIFVYGTKRIMKETQFSKEVEVFNNGQDALERLNEILELNQTFPNIILLDLNMPIMNGWDFLDHYIQLETYLKDNTEIFVVSSSVDPRDLKKVKQYHIVKTYISKPITPNDLEFILGTISI